MAVQGRREVGRPGRRWKDCMQEDVCAVGVVEAELERRKARRRKFHVIATKPEVG